MIRWWQGALGIGWSLVVMASCSSDEGPVVPNVGGEAAEAGGPPGSGAGGTVLPSTGGQGGGGGSPDEPDWVSCGAGPGGSGSGGASDPPEVMGVDCKGQPITLDAEHVRQCVLLTSCSSFPRESWWAEQTSDCIANGMDALDFQMTARHPKMPFLLDGRLARCLGELRTCGDVRACVGERAAAEECDAEQATRCDAELAITCGALPRLQDCGMLGGTCRVFGTGDEAHAECVVTENCEPAAWGVARCDGSKLYRCDEAGEGYGMDCGGLGLACVETNGTAACAKPLPTATCDAPGTGSCEGSTLRYCAEGGIAFERDCGVAGDLVCVEGYGDMETDAPWFDCSPKGCDVRFDAFDECEGDDLVLAVGGGVRIHCPDYGFATCSQGRCSNAPAPEPIGAGGAGGAGN